MFCIAGTDPGAAAPAAHDTEQFATPIPTSGVEYRAGIEVGAAFTSQRRRPDERLAPIPSGVTR